MKNKYSLLNYAFTFLLMFFVLPADISGAKEKVYIDINSPYLRKIPISIGCTRDDSKSILKKMSEETADVLKDDLQYSGYFSIKDIFQKKESEKEDRKVFISTLDDVSLYADCRVSYADEEVTAEFRLYDAVEERFIIGRRYRGRAEDLRRIVHRFSDEVLKRITGIRGSFESKIVYVSGGKGQKSLVVCDYDGKNAKVIRKDDDIIASPVWSRKGSKIAYTSYREGRPEMYVIDFDKGAERKVSLPGNLPLAGDWSPSGNRLAVTLSVKGNADIYVLDLDSGKLTNPFPGRYLDLSPSWSPDGRKIAFTSNRHGSPQIFIYDFSRNDVRRLTYSGSYNTAPSWSPDGRKIAFISRTNGRFHIATINASGTGMKYLTSESGNNESPSWSPDGRFIIFASDRDGVYKIYIMKSDGSGEKRIGMSGGKETEPQWSLRSLDK